MFRLVAIHAAILCVSLNAWAAPKKLLYVTFSGGFVHSSVSVSEQVLKEIGERSGAFEVTVMRDVSQITAAGLSSYDGLFFYTTGELPLDALQKQALLDFVRNGKGFGGVHSATDTNYTWPEYGDLIGAYFDGHPWVQLVTIQVEDPEHPAVRHLAPSFTITEEIYQFRNFSRDRVRVLMTLDVRSVDKNAPGINRTDNDFALAWVRAFGSGRVFYTALGHFDETWRDPRFQQHLLEGIRWMMGDLAGNAEPRPKPTAAPPSIGRGGVVHGASFAPAPDNVVAPGSIISIFGAGLTLGETRQASTLPLPDALGGTIVTVNGRAAPLLYVSPGQINAQFPFEVASFPSANVVVITGTGGSPAEPVSTLGVSAGVFTLDGTGRGPAAALHLDGRVVSAQQPARRGEVIQIFATGLGATNPVLASGVPAGASPPVATVMTPAVLVGGARAQVVFSGLAPGFVGLNQVNVMIPQDAPTGAAVELLFAPSNRTTLAVAP